MGGKTLQILIPTRGRPKFDLQRTYTALAVAGLEPRLIVDDEVDVPPGDWRYSVMYSSNVMDARNNCLEYAGEGKVLILDDDLTFYRRTGTGYVPSTPQDIRTMVDALAHQLDRFVYGGIPSKKGAMSHPSPVELNVRCLAVAAINMDKLPLVVEYRLKVHEDVDFILQLLELGHTTFRVNEFAYTDPGHVEGGVQTYATEELRRAEWDRLHAMHPQTTTGGPNGHVKWKTFRS